jgi:hypothetical protein
MKHRIRNLSTWFIWAMLGVLLQGCASKQVSKSDSLLPPVNLHSKSSKALYYTDDKQSLRLQKQLKAYPVGRYTDPNNPNILHEAHTIYRLEKPSKWNQSPNKPIVVPLGPTYAISDPNQLKSPINEALEQALIAQTEILQELQKQNEQLLNRIELLENEMHASNDRSHTDGTDAIEHR